MSPTFTDRRGNTWDLSINLGMLTTIREQLGIDLGSIFKDQEAFAKLLFDDVRKFGEVLYAIATDGDDSKIDPVKFAQGFDGPTISKARDALVVAIANFTQPPAIAGAAVEAIQKVMTAKIQKAVQTIKMAADSMSSDSGTN